MQTKFSQQIIQICTTKGLPILYPGLPFLYSDMLLRPNVYRTVGMVNCEILPDRVKFYQTEKCLNHQTVVMNDLKQQNSY